MSASKFLLLILMLIPSLCIGSELPSGYSIECLGRKSPACRLMKGDKVINPHLFRETVINGVLLESRKVAIKSGIKEAWEHYNEQIEGEYHTVKRGK